MSVATNATTYELFATQVEYVALNAAFIDTIVPHLESPCVVADIACGTGVMSELLLAALSRDPLRPTPLVVGVDRARDSLQIAGAARPPARASLWMEASAGRLPLGNDVADVAIVGNAIHLLDDLDQAIGEVNRVLRPRGVFAFNTTYHEGGGGDMRRFYGEFFQEARRRLKEWRHRSEDGHDTPKTGRARLPAVRLRPAEYAEAAARNGFTVVHLAERVVHLTRANFEAIAVYGEFAAQWSAYPADVVAPALIDAVGTVWDRFEVTTLPRRWLEVVSVKR